MSGEKVNMADAAQGNATDQASQRDRSSIEFPYGDLSNGIEIARAIYANAGLECSPDQLAGFMGQTTSSGAFRLKLGTARTFGLVESERGRVRLTDIGRGAMDPDQESAAKVRAFLRVPLYAAVFEKYRGHLLPPRVALEREMVTLGVAQKQKDKARWAFERSAEQAGFFSSGKDRLVEPVIRGRPDTIKTDEADAPPADRRERHETGTREGGGGNGTGGSGGGGGGLLILHPFVQGLLDTLPPPNTNWRHEGRAKWLQAAANIFDLIYKGDGEITVRAAPGKDDAA